VLAVITSPLAARSTGRTRGLCTALPPLLVAVARQKARCPARSHPDRAKKAVRLEDLSRGPRALLALDENKVYPMLGPVPRSGRASSTGVLAALKGYAAGTVTRLEQAGVPLKEACTTVARALVKLGARPERGRGPITATTVRHWRDDVATDVGRHGEAAIAYNTMFTDEERARFSSLPSDQARCSFALKSLAQWVAGALPELQNPVNPPS
jgi:hypothetical protein